MQRALASLLVLSVTLAGCPADDPPEPACVSDRVPAGFDPSPTTSFARDVVPIFRTSCAFSSCHGASSSNGVSFATTDASRLRKTLVETNATRLPSMPLVTPGDPTKSFLLRKVDGTQCALDTSCTDGSCGASMPYGGGLLDDATRSILRRWIVQGAKDD